MTENYLANFVQSVFSSLEEVHSYIYVCKGVYMYVGTLINVCIYICT
jgi:hypothetical protein